jgi:hypothetical protein
MQVAPGQHVPNLGGNIGGGRRRLNKLWKVVVAGVLLYHTFIAAHAQPGGSSQPAAQPSDLHFQLGTKDGRTEFHLGEIIDLEEAYSSDAPGKYLLLSLPAKLSGGHSAEVRMRPDEHVIDRTRHPGYRSANSVLNVNCSGISGGIGGGCADCDHVWPLKSAPIRFPFGLSAQFQIMEPGRYVIHAEAANVVLAPLSLENSVPISLTSNTVEIVIVDDPLWSREKLEEAVTSFETAHSQYLGKGLDALAADQLNPERHEAQISLQWKMQSSAEIMRVLDTEESLTEIVRRYDGATQNPDYFNHVLLSGITQSKHQALAVKLLRARILEPDFSVSKELIDQLTAMALENQYPGSLAADDIDSRRRYYPEARRILNDYILALGKSLSEKGEHALGPSLATFKWYAKEDFCSGEPLIPGATFERTLRQVRAFDSEPEP